ncbi:MAG: Smr/MutS family protein [Duncaniella sp.]|nr:Smr/MutS family protein [Duncaniella sp.]
MTYPERFESKIGFDGVRSLIRQRCHCEGGRRCCDDMAFMTSPADIASALRATEEMRASLEASETVPLDEIADIDAELRAAKVVGHFLSVTELVKVRKVLRCTRAVVDFFAKTAADEGRQLYPELAAISSPLEPCPAVAAVIDKVIDQNGNVKDNASPALADIRSQLRSMSGRVNSIMRRVMANAISQGLLDADTSPGIRDGRLVIPVSPMNKRKIPGIVHDESASGKTVFIEPAEVVEVNNLTRELQIEERREITRILTTVTDEIRPHADDLLLSADVLYRLDFIRAKGVFARESQGHLPHLSPRPELEWYHACHPVLERSLRKQGKEIVPIDITLSPEKRILVISGPNAGGKSVCLKTVGTLQYMAQCGVLPTLYENSHMGTFDDILVDIGDDQSIEDDLSTYSSHLRNMKLMVNRGRDTSLVLIDEFGGGTEPQIGGAIAQAILHRFNDLKMWGVITTHYQNLKHFADETPGLVNGSMLYDRHLMQPLFKLSIGTPGSSFALEIARKTGLPSAIIDEAKEIVGSEYVNLDNYLLDITRDKRYWENKRLSIKQKEHKLDQLLERYTADADTLRTQRKEIIEDARREARRIIDGSNAAVERTISDIRKAQAEKEETQEARRRLRDERKGIDATDTETDASAHPLLRKAPKRKKQRQPIPEVKPVEITVGSNVKLEGQTTVGTVTAISGKNATVTFGNLKTTVALSRLVATSGQPKSGASGKVNFVSSATTDASRARQLNFKQEIDVRGMRVDEAVQAVTYYIDDAVQFNARRVRILHGTGTGALKQYIRQYLSTIPGVASYHDEDVRLGGAGITVVELS